MDLESAIIVCVVCDHHGDITIIASSHWPDKFLCVFRFDDASMLNFLKTWRPGPFVPCARAEPEARVTGVHWLRNGGYRGRANERQ